MLLRGVHSRLGATFRRRGEARGTVEQKWLLRGECRAVRVCTAHSDATLRRGAAGAPQDTSRLSHGGRRRVQNVRRMCVHEGSSRTGYDQVRSHGLLGNRVRQVADALRRSGQSLHGLLGGRGSRRGQSTSVTDAGRSSSGFGQIGRGRSDRGNSVDRSSSTAT